MLSKASSVRYFHELLILDFMSNEINRAVLGASTGLATRSIHFIVCATNFPRFMVTHVAAGVSSALAWCTYLAPANGSMKGSQSDINEHFERHNRYGRQLVLSI